MKVLVALDASAASEAVLNRIVGNPWPDDTIFFLLSVVDTQTAPQDMVGVGSIIEFQTETAEAVVLKASERLARFGLKAVRMIKEGFPADEIVTRARERGADLIVVGSHDHGSFSRFLLGSTSRAVVRTAACPVEVVRGGPHARADGQDEARVLVATDGSPCSEAAVAAVAARRWPRNTTFRVVTVTDTTLPLADAGYIPADILDRIAEYGRKQSDEAVRDAVAKLSEAGLSVTGRILDGRPKAAILDEAKHWNADLIVLGSHGRRGVSRLFLGSVSETVAIHAGCSVLVVRGESPVE